MEKILVVEDSTVIGKSIVQKLKENGDDYLWAKTMKEVVVYIGRNDDIFASLLDLSLPDAPHGEVVDFVLEKEIPVIVFTSLSDDDTMDEMNRKNIVDYIIKNREEDIEYAIKILNQLKKNRTIDAMVVDDSKVYRKTLSQYLKNLMFRHVYEAVDGLEAQKILEEHPETKLLITDYHMPNMDGFELTLQIRKTRKKDSLVIIACTGKDSKYISSKFLKFGANDYIVKPFTKEEFNYRVVQNMEMLYIVEKLEEKKNRLLEYSTDLQKMVDDEVKKSQEKQRMLEIQSRQAQMGEMIAAIAHQWRQPLNALSITIQKLQLYHLSGQLNETHLDEAIEEAMEQIRYMSRTIDDFRNFFQPKKEKSDFNIVETVKKVMRLLEPVMEEYGIQTDLHVETDEIVVRGYENELSQVIISLINNAKDELVAHKEESRRIEVSVTTEEGYVKITVKDNGRGIDEAIIDRIFEPYFSTKENLNGTGLGLYLSKMIVEKNLGGKITARNGEEGAIFEILLPLASKG